MNLKGEAGVLPREWDHSQESTMWSETGRFESRLGSRKNLKGYGSGWGLWTLRERG